MMQALAFLQTSSPGKLLSLGTIDLLVIGLYFVMVLGIGLYLRRFTNTGEDFFLAGRDMSSWIAGLSFVAANLGSLELMGWAGSAYQYGILATHWYWIGAIPAMLFLAIVMMPFYYISKTHSVPGYLKLRFGEPSRMLSAITFGFMTVMMSGINMYSMALVMRIILGWDISFSIWVSSLTVMAYVFLGGLLSAIFNEVLQFFLIWLGAHRHLYPRLGRSGRLERHGAAHSRTLAGPGLHAHVARLWLSFSDNPMGIHWTGIVLGLGFVISFGYWTTDFLVVQRVWRRRICGRRKWLPSSDQLSKWLSRSSSFCPACSHWPFCRNIWSGKGRPINGLHSYNEVLPLMLARYCGPGLLGLGITALIAGFMSGMAGNVSAFATVWTYDIYRATINSNATDAHYVSVGRWCTVLGVLVSIGTAYLVMQFASIMDYVQALFSFFIAPLFGTVIFGMLWKRATSGRRILGLAAAAPSAPSPCGPG